MYSAAAITVTPIQYAAESFVPYAMSDYNEWVGGTTYLPNRRATVFHGTDSSPLYPPVNCEGGLSRVIDVTSSGKVLVACGWENPASLARVAIFDQHYVWDASRPTMPAIDLGIGAMVMNDAGYIFSYAANGRSVLLTPTSTGYSRSSGYHDPYQTVLDINLGLDIVAQGQKTLPTLEDWSGVYIDWSIGAVGGDAWGPDWFMPRAISDYQELVGTIFRSSWGQAAFRTEYGAVVHVGERCGFSDSRGHDLNNQYVIVGEYMGVSSTSGYGNGGMFTFNQATDSCVVLRKVGWRFGTGVYGPGSLSQFPDFGTNHTQIDQSGVIATRAWNTTNSTWNTVLIRDWQPRVLTTPSYIGF